MFRSILIDDFMTKNLATATRDMDLLALVDLLLRRGISGTPVVDQSGYLIGMVSEHDCLKAILVGTYQGDVGGIVGDVMTTQVDTIRLGTSIVEAANQMVSSGRRRLPVVDQENRLVGQISRTDLLRAVRAYEIPEDEPAH
ncbi:MAG TPA: CBS domain-containing protein [Gammaproteobacteria bacterium]|jgi:CBS domain-containing protein|nr:CBS domain-containing protein [Litorivicinus sp.]MDA8631145.1 CBS domain-containing protein [Litorivicinaceae bacterium]MDB3998494.1 CBS domain-containing protein [Litorivicinus sp.]NBR75446.1 CBS domain-containing protein [Gammaproteobacteria bacterium]HAY54746.1 CBS domain-containing protein [Gammaproteobacteria bacterium]|tara:strand:+ start:144 stop:566 length:423 start_codon:yes stop_codon:yes gene_type:complete